MFPLATFTICLQVLKIQKCALLLPSIRLLILISLFHFFMNFNSIFSIDHKLTNGEKTVLEGASRDLLVINPYQRCLSEVKGET